jgi:hypothetical protein
MEQLLFKCGYMIKYISLTAIGFTPASSSTVHFTKVNGRIGNIQPYKYIPNKMEQKNVKLYGRVIIHVTEVLAICDVCISSTIIKQKRYRGGTA